MDHLLRNYHSLIARADELCDRIVGSFSQHLNCRAGCDGCCRHLSVFWVEGMALAGALSQLPQEQAVRIRQSARGSSVKGQCPLLHDHQCLLYAARPLICRTHGLPLISTASGQAAVDFCPQNFQGVESLPGSAVIDLDRLNTALAAVNALFVSQYFPAPPEKERITIAEALLIEL